MLLQIIESYPASLVCGELKPAEAASQRVSIRGPHGISPRRQYVKKQTGSKKLILSKETLTQVTQVYGGSQINDTVYRYPVASRDCVTNSSNCGIA